MEPESDNLQGALNHEGSERYRYSAAEFLAPASEFKIYQQTLTESYPLHWLEFYEVFLVLGGKGVHAVNGQSHRLRPGTLCLLTPADFHAIRLSPGDVITLSGVMFDEKLIDEGLRQWLFQSHDYYHVQPPAKLERLLSYEFERLQAENQAPDSASGRVMAGALERILIYLARCAQGISPPSGASRGEVDTEFPASIQRALLYIHHHFRQPLTLEEAAQQACLAPNYFSERFHTLVGVSFQRYLQGLRLRFAAKLLSASTLPVSEVLLAAGFRDQTHFGRAFKKLYHVSPRQYRQVAHQASGRRPQPAQ
jgi:AraC-like DNA-binding protein